MKKIICLLIAGIFLLTLVSCNTGTYQGSNTPEIKVTTSNQAISIAKNSAEVENKIASVCSFKFFYSPDWGTCTAKEDSSGNWQVTMKCNMSGYTDDYKNKFDTKNFTMEVTISSNGTVTNVTGKWWK